MLCKALLEIMASSGDDTSDVGSFTARQMIMSMLAVLNVIGQAPSSYRKKRTYHMAAIKLLLQDPNCCIVPTSLVNPYCCDLKFEDEQREALCNEMKKCEPCGYGDLLTSPLGIAALLKKKKKDKEKKKKKNKEKKKSSKEGDSKTMSVFG